MEEGGDGGVGLVGDEVLSEEVGVFGDLGKAVEGDPLAHVVTEGWVAVEW